MKLRTPASALAVAGILLGVAALVILSWDTGGCPLMTADSPPCDHTFPGTNIWIGQTATTVGTIAIVVLVAAVAVAATGSLTKRHQR